MEVISNSDFSYKNLDVTQYVGGQYVMTNNLSALQTIFRLFNHTIIIRFSYIRGLKHRRKQDIK